MKTLISFAISIACAAFLDAEEIEVFTCDSIPHDIQWGETGDEKTTTALYFHRLKKLLGKIDTGEKSFSQIAVEAATYDSSGDPFFGPGENYIVKDRKGRHFILFFEYKEGDRRFTGFRMAINNVILIGPKLGVFEGSPYSGESSVRSFDKGILAQLKSLTKKAEQADDGVRDK